MRGIIGLKPCPLCNCDNKVLIITPSTENYKRKLYSVKCCSCGFEISAFYEKAVLTNVWNHWRRESESNE